jgi:hypothetical protein
MKTLAILIVICALAQCEKYEIIHKFSDKSGNEIAYLKGLKRDKDLYTHFLIENLNNETLYSVVENKLFSGNDLELNITEGGDFYGYKILLMKDDYIVLSYFSNNGQNVADDITIKYDHEVGKFKLLVLP